MKVWLWWLLLYITVRIQKTFLTKFLFPISSDLTDVPGLQVLLRWGQTDGLHWCTFLCTLAVFGLQLQQCCKTIISGLVCSRLWCLIKLSHIFVPMSLLKFPSLLSKPSWMMISSTLNVCSTVGSVSFRAFLPSVTDKLRCLVWELRHKCTRISPIFLLLLSTSGGYSKWSHILPVWEAVGSCEDPTGGDQTPAAAENLLLGFATPKYGSNPRMGFHSCNCATHNLHLLSSSAQATRWLCSCQRVDRAELNKGQRSMKTQCSEFREVWISRLGSRWCWSLHQFVFPFTFSWPLTMLNHTSASAYLSSACSWALPFRKVVNLPGCVSVGWGGGGTGSSKLESFSFLNWWSMHAGWDFLGRL